LFSVLSKRLSILLNRVSGPIVDMRHIADREDEAEQAP